jgi:chromosome segregation ATPase
MSERRYLVLGASLVLAIGMLGACAKPPRAELDQAQAALKAAREAEAPTYSSQAWDTAQKSMNAATAEIEAQNAKFALTRSYKKAQGLLATAQQDAAAAQQAAVEGKELAKAEVEQAVAQIEASFAQADELLQKLETCRRRPKGFASDLELLRGNVDGLRGQLTDVQATAAEEQYIEAKSLAQELLGQVDSVVADLESAKAKIGC